MASHDHLLRLSPQHYRGYAYVHWIFTIRHRATGWLTDPWHRTFRELLTHALARFDVCCPVYCLMPDHVHLLWIGFSVNADQKRAIALVRRSSSNLLLKPSGLAWQRQPYDHVLRSEERDRDAFEEVAAYILLNPQRAHLVDDSPIDSYPFLGCVAPGYPELDPRQDNFWDAFWKIYWRLRDDTIPFDE